MIRNKPDACFLRHSGNLVHSTAKTVTLRAEPPHLAPKPNTKPSFKPTTWGRMWGCLSAVAVLHRPSCAVLHPSSLILHSCRFRPSPTKCNQCGGMWRRISEEHPRRTHHLCTEFIFMESQCLGFQAAFWQCAISDRHAAHRVKSEQKRLRCQEMSIFWRLHNRCI
jgi:hypothetical protein